MLPIYSGLRTLDKGPEVHKNGAPTTVVRVAPPAYRTDHIRINSPKTKRTVPTPNTAWFGEEK